MRRPPVQSDRRFKPKSSSDRGTLERWQHGAFQLELTEIQGILAARALEEHILDTLCLNDQITHDECKAGLRLWGDFQRAGLEPHWIRSYGQMRRDFTYFSSTPDRDDQEEAAYQRWRGAVAALPFALRSLTLSVVCYGEQCAHENTLRLRQALQILVLTYFKQ